jgi:hypothetical protein
VGLVARTPRNLGPRGAGWGPFLRMAVWLARAACPVQPPAPALVVRKLLALEELLPICCPGLPEPLGGQRAPGRRTHRWGWRRLDRSVRATARAGRLVRMLGKVVEPAVIAAGFAFSGPAPAPRAYVGPWAPVRSASLGRFRTPATGAGSTDGTGTNARSTPSGKTSRCGACACIIPPPPRRGPRCRRVNLPPDRFPLRRPPSQRPV